MYAYIIALKEEVAFWAEMLKACGQNEDTLKRTDFHGQLN